MLYYSFTNQHEIVGSPELITANLFTDTRCWILVIISGIFALILTTGQYRGEID